MRKISRPYDPATHPYFAERKAKMAQLLNTPAIGNLGSYEVVGAMRGGMGEILIVRRKNAADPPSLEVLKTVPRERMNFDAAHAALAREAVSAYLLKDSWIMPFTDVVREPLGGKNRLFLKMLFAMGGSLRDRLEYGHVPTEEAVYYLLWVSASLAAIHSKGLVHRDIKPDNILLDMQNDTVIPLVADFGLTQHIQSNRPGGFTGTLLYAAPEQLKGESVGPPADIWALAVSVLEILIHEHPYLSALEDLPNDETTTNLLADRLATRDPQHFSGLPHDVEWLSTLLAAAVSYCPADRPTAKEILNCLSGKISLFANHDKGLAFVGSPPDACGFSFSLSCPIAVDLFRYHGWQKSGPVYFSVLDMGWSSRLKRANDLVRLDTYGSYKTAVLNLDEVLGKPDDDRSVLAQFLRDPKSSKYDIQIEDSPISKTVVPIGCLGVLEVLDMKVRCLVDMVERYAYDCDVKSLQETTELWARTRWIGLSRTELSELGAGHYTPGELHLCRLAQGMYYSNRLPEAESLIKQARSMLGHHGYVDSLLYLIYDSADRFSEALRHSREVADFHMQQKDRANCYAWLGSVVSNCEALGYMDDLGEVVRNFRNVQSFRMVTGRIIWKGRAAIEIEKCDIDALNEYLGASSVDLGDPSYAPEMVEVLWYLHDFDRAKEVASYGLKDRRCHLPRHRRRVPILEAVSQGEPMFYMEVADSRGASALHHAARGGHLHLTKELLRFGWNPNHADIDGLTPIDYATAKGRTEVASLLREQQ